MDDLTNLAYKSIDRYFKTLATLGYKSYDEVNKLLILLYMEEILNNMSMFVDDNDYREIAKALDCLSGGTCLIDFPDYSVYDELYHKNTTSLSVRAMEYDSLRSSINNMRIEE